MSMFEYIAHKIETLGADQVHPVKMPAIAAPSSLHLSTAPPAQTCVFPKRRILVAGYPGDVSRIRLPPKDRSLAPISSADLARVIGRMFEGRPYLVFNLSNEQYDYSSFADQVVAYALHKYPAPPFDLLCEIVEAMKGWLDGDDARVAVVHDVSGRRSLVVLACLEITESMEEDVQSSTRRGQTRTAAEIVQDTMARLRMVSSAKAPIDGLVPSQLRYINYYASYMEETLLGRRSSAYHSSKKLVLQRVIVNGVPDFVNAAMPTATSGGAKVQCVPFVKIYMGEQLIGGTSPDATVTPEDACFRLEPCMPYPGQNTENPEGKPCVVCGDVLLKVFHWAGESRRPVPMFSVMFHTGFIADNVLHLDAEQVDGAKRNARFPEDFFIDCFFSDRDIPFTETAEPETRASASIDTASVKPSPEANVKEEKLITGDSEKAEEEERREIAETLDEIEAILNDAGDIQGGDEGEVDLDAFAESLNLDDKDELDQGEFRLSDDDLDLDEFVSTFDSA